MDNMAHSILIWLVANPVTIRVLSCLPFYGCKPKISVIIADAQGNTMPSYLDKEKELSFDSSFRLVAIHAFGKVGLPGRKRIPANKGYEL